MTAVSAAALTGSASRGEASVTSPAPARSAARADIRAAPVEAISPDTTRTCPRAYLWPSIRGTGNDLRQNCGVFSKRLRTDLVQHVRVDADIGDADAAALHAAGQQEMRRLLAEESHGLGGAHRGTHDRAWCR